MICDDDFYAGKCPARKEDGRCVSKFPCSHKVEPPKPPTNADRIRAVSDEELADFISSIAYDRETPWNEPFARKLCDRCQTVHGTYESGIEDDFHECDFVDGKCPHGSAIMWWLQQPAEEGEHE